MKIAYLRSSFPKSTETFIMEEVRCLLAAGHDVRVFAFAAELGAVQPKFLQHRLVDHVHYVPVTTSLPRNALHLLHFAESMALQRSYARGYWRNLFPGRSPARAVLERVRVRGLRSVLPLIMRSSRINNLSLAIHDQESLASFAPDVVHCPFLFEWEVTQLASIQQTLPTVPFTVVLRSRDLHRDQVGDPLYQTKVWLLARAARILAISRYNRDFVLAGTLPHTRAAAGRGIAAGIPIVHSSIDTTFFAPDPAVRTRAGQVVCVARLVPKKGLHLLIEACALLRERGVAVSCVIVGDGALQAPLEALIRRRKLEAHVRIQAVCTHDEVRRTLAQSQVFVLPCVVATDGDRDMLPNSLKEAMAMQLPVVTSDISGIEELVSDGVNGLLVAPGSAEELAQAMTRLLGDPELRASLGAAGREVIVRDFDIERESRKLIDVLSEVVASARIVTLACKDSA